MTFAMQSSQKWRQLGNARGSPEYAWWINIGTQRLIMVAKLVLGLLPVCSQLPRGFAPRLAPAHPYALICSLARCWLGSLVGACGLLYTHCKQVFGFGTGAGRGGDGSRDAVVTPTGTYSLRPRHSAQYWPKTHVVSGYLRLIRLVAKGRTDLQIGIANIL